MFLSFVKTGEIILILPKRIYIKIIPNAKTSDYTPSFSILNSVSNGKYPSVPFLKEPIQYS